MLRTTLLAAVLGAMALPAFADTTVKINVSGLDAKAAQAKIYEAAQKACRIELSDSTALVQYYNRPDCIAKAVNHADASLARAGNRLASR
jgi:UrcA family protein